MAITAEGLVVLSTRSKGLDSSSQRIGMGVELAGVGRNGASAQSTRQIVQGADQSRVRLGGHRGQQARDRRVLGNLVRPDRAAPSCSWD